MRDRRETLFYRDVDGRHGHYAPKNDVPNDGAPYQATPIVLPTDVCGHHDSQARRKWNAVELFPPALDNGGDVEAEYEGKWNFTLEFVTVFDQRLESTTELTTWPIGKIPAGIQPNYSIVFHCSEMYCLL